MKVERGCDADSVAAVGLFFGYPCPPGKTICREIIINFDEKSVKGRKHRKRTRNDFVQCTQKALIFHNNFTQVNFRDHKHFQGSSNMSNTLGPVALPSWSDTFKLMIKEKKEFWGARRRAVGGRTERGSESGSDESDESDDGVDSTY